MKYAALAAALLLGRASPAPAADLSAPAPVAYTKRIALDTAELPSKIFNWDSGQWLLAGGVVTSAGLSLWLFDEKIRDYNEKHRSELWRNISWSSTHFGDYRYQVPIISSLWVAGRAFDSPILKKTAADAGEASIISAFLINPTICFLTGRALPSANENSNKFIPFRLGRYSFPSGHTTAAFALATVLDKDLRPALGYWHTPIVYGLALGVAHSRLYDQKHYLSEVIVGGSIGWAIGDWIASKYPLPGTGRNVSVSPYGRGLKLSMKF